ncbi:MAG: dTDP-4-dehydrorhamnose reductase [Actinomycetota bacterium]|nr:dTDP-4-dehydrorhamnose reductase [Actinomycetota bacterium]
MTRVLVTGGNGQVGRSITDLLGDQRFQHLTVSVADRATCDITNPDAVRRAIERFNPSVIVNTAAYTAVDASETDEAAAMLVNCDGVAHLAAQTGRRLIHLSTDYVFDGSKDGWYMESDPVAPLGVYGTSKWQGEQAARTNPDHLILRTAWVYAAHGHNFVKTMLRLGAERGNLRVVADQIGCPTSAHDIADAILRLVDIDATGTYHMAGASQATWHELATATFELAELDVAVEAIGTAENPTPAPRPANSRLDSTALASATHVRLPSWQDSLPAVIDAARSSVPSRNHS